MSWRSSKERRPKLKRGLALCDPELRRRISQLGAYTINALGLNPNARVTAGMTDEEKVERRKALALAKTRRRRARLKLERARAEARERRRKEREAA